MSDEHPRRRSSSTHPAPTFAKFPDLTHEQLHTPFEEYEDAPPLPNGIPTLHSSERWPVRKSRHGGGAGRGRQKSLSEAIHTVRNRQASITENAHEIAESLKAPVSIRLVILCCLWFASSILTNTSSKAILTALPRPVTLTIVQFLLVSFWCLFLSAIAKHNRSFREAMPVLKNGIRKPSREIILVTLPLTAFQIGGHILNSDAMARIPVSLVHTIKGLSPLMTVFAYRAFFDIQYSLPTYLSLIPLTLGVVMACSASFAGNLIGLAYAFGSAILFVTQNIVSKSIFNDAAQAEADGAPIQRRKPDKINLLCYSSVLAFLFTLPIWLWSEGLAMAADYLQDASITLTNRPGSLDHGRLALEFLFNGTFHFAQSLLAFVLLGMVSPVTYSVASLIKRVVVIMFAIVWFGSPMTTVQGFGFLLTFLGLYLYDRTVERKPTKRRIDPLLPLTTGEKIPIDGTLPPGTKAQETWSSQDRHLSVPQHLPASGTG
ncbi:TPT-domain-containing protein [Piedraia hortae CBS 480.64]|uniref:TPT-domain-containing protein n=1 Tax=Piedraia hortae CBS 480.64 TaxID=1314780 RepID=A0A6A7C2N6_9PEZI|nr:TPT-domain-containing protein [Piedraia hortae CBS 480.64]